jgi:hypothetical protein
MVALAAGQSRAQEPQAGPSPVPEAQASVPWKVALTASFYLLPDQSDYVDPVLTADHGWLHLEARYNYENLRTGSIWAGYNFQAGSKLTLKVTPIVGVVFGRTAGIAPGCEASLSYKKIALSISNEYVFDLRQKSGNFYYNWPQLTYSPTKWLSVGLVAQRTKPFKTKLDTQRGFFLGFSHKKASFTAYIFNVGRTDPSAVLEAGWNF